MPMTWSISPMEGGAEVSISEGELSAMEATAAPTRSRLEIRSHLLHHCEGRNTLKRGRPRQMAVIYGACAIRLLFRVEPEEGASGRAPVLAASLTVEQADVEHRVVTIVARKLVA